MSIVEGEKHFFYLEVVVYSASFIYLNDCR